MFTVSLRDTLIEAVLVGTGATAIAAFIVAVVALLTGEFVGTRTYLLVLALISVMLATLEYLATFLIPNGEALLPTALSDAESQIAPNLVVNEEQD